MVENLSAKTPPATLVATICRETEGNPFFVEELVRCLEQENRLYDSAAQWAVKMNNSPMNKSFNRK